MKIKTTVHFRQLQHSDKRISVHQGGTRSGKTWNILLWFIIKLLNEEKKTLTICRKTLPALKATAFRDFISILDSLKIYDRRNLNKSEMTYNLGTNLIEFISLDDSQKVRGRKRDYLFLNEANEVGYDDWKQLTFRTTGKIVLDYNPSDIMHFIFDKIIPREDADFLQTTYKDNPFLEDVLIREVESLKETDPWYWQVYGLGEPGMTEAIIFKNWKTIHDFEDAPGNEDVYGLDFGYNNPTALIRVKIYDKNVYLKEELHEQFLTGKMIIDKLQELIPNRRAEIYGDCSRPELIQEIYKARFNIHPSIKGKNSVKDGIDLLKRYRMYIDIHSLNLIKELKMYKWKEDKNGNLLDEPVDKFNHLLDATRYAVFSRKKKINTTKAMLGR